MTAVPRIVVVGAGAVGAVYAHHLALGGGEVSFYARPARREALAAGVVLDHVRLLGARRRARFVPARVVTSPGELSALGPDELWLATDSEALEGEWLGPVLRAAPRATVVCLPPGERAEALVRAHVDAERLVRGLIGMISWKSPLAGSADPRELGEPRYSVVLSKSRFSGARAADVVARLRQGGCPAVLDARAPWALASGSALLLPHVAALETVGWSFARFAASDAPRLALGAAREMLALAARAHAARVPLFARLLPVFAVRLLSRLVPRLAPFDVETYFRVHFTKVGGQTRHILRDAIREAEEAGLGHRSLDALAQTLLGPDAERPCPDASEPP